MRYTVTQLARESVGLCSFHASYIGEFKLSHSNPFKRIMKVTCANLSPYLNINYCFIARTLKNKWSFILNIKAGETELINYEICALYHSLSQIRREMSWSSTHTKIWTLKQLHHCTQLLKHKDISMLCILTPLAVIKDEKIVKNQDGGLKVPLFDL